MSEAIIKYINAPLSEATIKDLHAGDVVRISGYIYTARDAAHKRMTEALAKGEQLPFDVRDQVIYYVGPSPTKPRAEVVGSCRTDDQWAYGQIYPDDDRTGDAWDDR